MTLALEALARRCMHITIVNQPPSVAIWPSPAQGLEGRSLCPRWSRVASTGRLHELFAKLTNEHVNDLLFWLVHSAVEVVEEHFFRDRGPLPHRKQFKNPVLLGRQ